MFGKVKPENLPFYLEKIRRLFPEYGDLRAIDVGDIKRYYEHSFWGYAIFHSWAGAIHMALSPSGRFSQNDYFRQAEEIAVVLRAQGRTPKMRVVEIGCGRGFNLQYLAQEFPEDAFHGVELSDRNLLDAKKHLQTLPNVLLTADDFHELSSIQPNSVDVLFAVESLCHATDLDKAFNAMSRVVVPGGRLIVFDGFRDNSRDYGQDVRFALRYAEQAVAVPSFKDMKDFIAAGEMRGFYLEYSENRSGEVMPNLIRLSDLAKGFFKFNLISKATMRLLPYGLVANAIAGLLMAVTVKGGAHRYMKLSLRKSA